MFSLDPARCSARPNLFGGHGTVRVWDLGGRTPPFTAILYCELDPAGTVGKHVQQTDDEVIIILQGRAVIVVDDAADEHEPGAAIGLKLGSTLAIENGSPHEPLRYLIVKARRA